jgi:predicted permease
MIAIVAAILASGWAGLISERRRPGRAGPGSRRALSFALYTVVPLIVFFNLARADLDADLAVGIVLAWASLGVCTALAYLACRGPLGLRAPETGAVLVCILVANTGYLGYPLVAATLGFDRLGDAVAFDIGVGLPALLIGGFAAGAAFGTRAGEGVAERTRAFFARNIPLYAAALALIAPDSLAPDLLVDASRIGVVLLLPLGFFAVGAALAEDEELGRVPLPPPLTPPVAVVAGLKLALMPALLYLLAAPLIDLPSTFLLLAAMPSGLNAMIVAHAYGLDLRITAGALTWTTAIVVPVALVASLA